MDINYETNNAPLTISKTELMQLISDISYSTLHHKEKAMLGTLFLLTPTSRSMFLFRKQKADHLGKDEESRITILERLSRIEEKLRQFFSSISMPRLQVTGLFYNWEYVILFTADPCSMTHEEFLVAVQQLEVSLSIFCSENKMNLSYTRSPIGETTGQINRMYMDARMNMDVMLFTGHSVHIKDKVTDRSIRGRFDAKDKRLERDYFLKLISCDFDGAIECLDQLLEMVGTGVYKDLDVFLGQLCACMELTAYILGFKAGNEQLLTPLIPDYAGKIRKTTSFRTKAEFRDSTLQMIRKIKNEVYFATNIKTATVEEAVQIIRQRYQDPQFSAEELSKTMNFSMTYLSKVFRKETNFTVSGYIRYLRIERARELLAETELDIDTVARQSGFASDKTFYRVFVNTEGVTPGTYRRHAIGERNEIK